VLPSDVVAADTVVLLVRQRMAPAGDGVDVVGIQALLPQIAGVGVAVGLEHACCVVRFVDRICRSFHYHHGKGHLPFRVQVGALSPAKFDQPCMRRYKGKRCERCNQRCGPLFCMMKRT